MVAAASLVEDAAPPPGSAEAGATPSAAAGKTPENLARLPPKLRERLLKRGILKEADVRAAGVPLPGQEGAAKPSNGDAPSEDVASPGTPPGPPPEDAVGLAMPEAPMGSAGAMAMPPPAVPAIVGALPKAAAPAVPAAANISAIASSIAADLHDMKEVRRQRWLAQQQMAPPGDVTQNAGVSEVVVEAAMAQAHAKAKAPPPAPPRTVFSAAPVLNKRPAEEAPEEEPESKRAHADDSTTSPAEARAALAQGNQGETWKAPVWVYSDGAVSEVGSARQAAAADVGTSPSPSASSTAPAPNSDAGPAPPSGPPPATDPSLPSGWVRVPHDGDFYYWNTTTNEVSWDHPAGVKEEKPVFKEEYKVLRSDLGKLIGKQGMNLKIIKASIGADVKVPKSGQGKSKGKGKDGKGKGKSKPETVRGQGTGEKPIDEDQFVKVIISAETAHLARGGKRCLEVMLGYGRSVERALQDLGVVPKLPSLAEMTGEGGKKNKDGVDPMDPSAYSDAPQGGWSAGLAKVSGRAPGGGSGGGKMSSSQENAERF